MAKSIISRRLNVSGPSHTLSFVKGDEDAHSFASDEESIHTMQTEKIKTEKSVRFAKKEESLSFEEESISDSLETSKDIITWVPSENLYSEDTFIPETITGGRTTGYSETRTPTDPTYGSSTFIELESDDETKTEENVTVSFHTGTGSLASSDVFSGSSHYKSWRDVTEIVKDIEDLEESEFVTRQDAVSFDEEDITEAEDSFEEHLARHDFIEHSIHRLLMKRDGSPSEDSQSSGSVNKDFSRKYTNRHKLTVAEKKQVAKFCQEAVKTVSKNSNEDNIDEISQKCQDDRDISPLYLEAKRQMNLVVENFGLSSSVLDRLKMENLQYSLAKKSKDLDEQIMRSEKYVSDHAHIEAEGARKRFLAQACAQVLVDNADDRIQTHLIKMHPVKCFAEFVSQLPKHDEGFRDVLYHYKKQVEDRMKTEAQE